MKKSSAFNHQIISRKEAEGFGIKRYFTGVPCKYGHISERFVSDSSCCMCKLISIQNKRTSAEFRKKEIDREMQKRSIDPEYKSKRNSTSRKCYHVRKLDSEYISYRKEQNKHWNQSEQGRTWVKNYVAKRLKQNSLVLISSRLRSRIKEAFRKSGYTKRSKTFEIIGCSFDELKTHIEKQFLPNMNWNNKNLWHIDHIIPLATAKTEDELIALNHMTNLRPIWAKDNLQKNSKLTHLI